MRTELAAGKSEPVEPLGELERFEPGRAEELERMRRAASLAEVRPLHEAHAGIDGSGEDGGHVRRGDDPREAGVAPPHAAAPAAHRYDGEVAVQLEDAVEIARQLAGGHAVTGRQREEAHEARVLLLADVSFEVHPVDRIGAIEHDHREPDRGRRPHAERHGVDEGVVTRADVLQIDHQSVERPEDLPAGRQILLAAAVERMDGEAGERVDGVSDVLHVLRFAPDPVLRPEERRQLPSAPGMQQAHGVAQIARDCALVRDQTDLLPGDGARVVEEHFEAGAYGHRKIQRAVTKGDVSSSSVMLMVHSLARQ